MVNSMKSNPELIKIGDNMTTIQKLIDEKVIAPSRKVALKGIVDHFDDRLALCPSSTRTEYQGAYMGGMVEHSLNVVRLMAELNNTYKSGISAETIVTVGLFHDIGKVGNLEMEYYISKNSDWHNRLGIMYEINPEISQTPVSQRSLFLLQHFGVALTEEEHTAISSIKATSRQGDDSLPVGNEPMLSVVLSQAVRVCCLRGKGKTTVLP